MDGKAFCEAESYWIKSFAGRFQTHIQPELLKSNFLQSTVFPKHSAREHGKRKQIGPKDDTNPVPTDSPLSKCWLDAQMSTIHPWLVWDWEFQVLLGVIKRRILRKKSHCQCSYWNLISRLQHITTLCLPGNSELIIKSISLFMWLGIHLVQRSFMTLFLPKISVIIWSHNPAVPWFAVTQ